MGQKRKNIEDPAVASAVPVIPGVAPDGQGAAGKKKKTKKQKMNGDRVVEAACAEGTEAGKDSEAATGVTTAAHLVKGEVGAVTSQAEEAHGKSGKPKKKEKRTKENPGRGADVVVAGRQSSGTQGQAVAANADANEETKAKKGGMKAKEGKQAAGLNALGPLTPPSPPEAQLKQGDKLERPEKKKKKAKGGQGNGNGAVALEAAPDTAAAAPLSSKPTKTDKKRDRLALENGCVAAPAEVVKGEKKKKKKAKGGKGEETGALDSVATPDTALVAVASAKPGTSDTKGDGAALENGCLVAPATTGADVVKEKKKKIKKDKEAKEATATDLQAQGVAAAEKKLAAAENGAVAPTDGAAGAGSGEKGKSQDGTASRSFQRVKAEEWLDKKGAWDNSYKATFGESGWGARAQAVLGTVRGKDFRHEKTKKKRGSYRGGLITPDAVNSFKFESDDE